MIPGNEKVIKDIVWSVRRLVRAVYLDSQKISKQYGLTSSQSSVLRSLLKYGPTSSADLSRMLYVTPSNITGVIDRLEKKRLVERVRKVGDRRVALIQLTEAGENLGRKLPDPIEERFISELADLEPEHVQLLSMAMNQILKMTDSKGVEEAPLELNHEPGTNAVEVKMFP
jgi:DNA-binding MarR family transcriptional regulator